MSTVEIVRTLTQAEFDAFADLSGDDNPIHVDPAYAAHTPFGRPVAHGVMLYGILRGLAHQLLPGARQTAQEITFPAPTFADEPVRFSVRMEGADRVAVRAERMDGHATCEGWMEFSR